MATIQVHNTLDDLASDTRTIATTAKRDMARIVRGNAKQGNTIAKRYAKASAGRHGKLYHLAFSAESRGELTWEYGPDSAMPQGGMSFEGGSRNQPAHNDLAKSRAIIGPSFAHDVATLADHLFWPS